LFTIHRTINPSTSGHSIALIVEVAYYILKNFPIFLLE